MYLAVVKGPKPLLCAQQISRAGNRDGRLWILFMSEWWKGGIEIAVKEFVNLIGLFLSCLARHSVTCSFVTFVSTVSFEDNVSDIL